jgi:hypothetical protein
VSTWQFRPNARRPETRLTPFQSWIITTQARCAVAVAARRSGKTVGARGRIIKSCLSSAPGDVGYMAPTLGQAKRLIWRPLMLDLRAPEARNFIQGKPNHSELTIEFKSGTRLYLYSAEAAERVRGDGFKDFITDETDDPLFKPEIFDEIIWPALGDNRGSLLQLGTPKGRGRLYTEFCKGRKHHKTSSPDYASRQVTAIEAGLLDKAEIERARKTLPARAFLQEYGAQFNAPTGLVYDEWNEERHIVSADAIPREFDEVIACADWGVAKRGAMLVLGIDHVWVGETDEYEGQEMPRVWVIEEHSTAGTPYNDAGWWKIARQIQQTWHPRYWYPDPAGGSAEESEAQAAGLVLQLRQVVQGIDNRVEVIPGDNKIGPGIAAVQTFMHYDDVCKEPPRLFVGRNCPWLIKEMGSYRYPANRKFEGQEGEEYDDKPVKGNDHAADSLRYGIFTHFYRSKKRGGRNLGVGHEARGG